MLVPCLKVVKYFSRTSTNSEMPFYAVSRGRKNGVFETWEECKEQVKGFSGAKFKKFNTMAEAKSFVSGAKSQKFNTMAEAKSFVSGFNDAASSGYSSSTSTENRSSMRNKLATAIASHIPIPPLKRMRVGEDESVVIENKDAFHHLDHKNSSHHLDHKNSFHHLDHKKSFHHLDHKKSFHHLDYKKSFHHLDHVPAIKVEDPDHIVVEDVKFSSQDPENIFEPRCVFVVMEGRKKGIYRSIAEAWNEIEGFPNSFVKTFKDEDDARFFLENYKSNGSSSSSELPSSERSVLEQDGAKRHVHVWTDGACESNGTARAAAGIGVYWGENDERNVSEPLLGRQTNNRAEIQAAVRAVREAKKEGYASVTVHTDSLFLINSMTKWVTGWIRRGWTLSSGAPVVNKEDFLQLLQAMQGIHVNWHKVSAHSGDEGNEQADRLARDGINKPLVTASSWNTPSSQTTLRQ